MTPLVLEKRFGMLTDRRAGCDVAMSPARVQIARPGRPAARIPAVEYSAAHLDSVT